MASGARLPVILRWLLPALLLVLGAILVVVGIHDLVSVPRPATKLLAGGLAAIGAVSLVGAWYARPFGPWRESSLPLIAAASCGVVAAATVLAQLVNDAPFGLVVVAVTILAVLAVAVISMLRGGLSFATPHPIAKTFGGIGSIVVSFSFLQFALTDLLPSPSSGPVLSMNIELTPTTSSITKNGQTLIPVDLTVSVTNEGGAKAVALETSFAVYGIPTIAAGRSLSPEQQIEELTKVGRGDQSGYNKLVGDLERSLMGAGRVTSPGLFYPAGGQATEQQVLVYVPADGYQAVTAVAQVCFGDVDGLGRGPTAPRVVTSAVSVRVHRTFEIERDSWIAAVTRGPEVVAVSWEPGRCTVEVGRFTSDGFERSLRLEDVHGVQRFTAVATASLVSAGSSGAGQPNG